MHDAAVANAIRRHAVPVDIESAAQRLLELIDPSVAIVLIGEATHGTLDFYRTRAGTRGVEPLERWGRHEVDLPETYPTGV